VLTFVKLLVLEKSKSAGLKKNLMAVVEISVGIIALLVAAMFGADFVAVNATKDTAISSSGALMTKDGSRQLSTIALNMMMVRDPRKRFRWMEVMTMISCQKEVLLSDFACKSRHLASLPPPHPSPRRCHPPRFQLDTLRKLRRYSQQ
jgi:hypothetical protein